MTAQLSSLSYSVCLLFDHVDVLLFFLFSMYNCQENRRVKEEKLESGRSDRTKDNLCLDRRRGHRMLLEKDINKNFTMKNISSHFYCLNLHLLCTQKRGK